MCQPSKQCAGRTQRARGRTPWSVSHSRELSKFCRAPQSVSWARMIGCHWDEYIRGAQVGAGARASMSMGPYNLCYGGRSRSYGSAAVDAGSRPPLPVRRGDLYICGRKRQPGGIEVGGRRTLHARGTIIPVMGQQQAATSRCSGRGSKPLLARGSTGPLFARQTVAIWMWVREQEPTLPWNLLVCCSAAGAGQLKALKWLQEQDPPCPWYESTCTDAAEGGHLEVLVGAGAKPSLRVR